VFSKDGDWTVTSDEGTLDNNRRDVSLKGNVIIRSSDGLEMRTPTLAWNNEQRALATDDDVQISRRRHHDHRQGPDGPDEGRDARDPPERAVVINDRTKSNLAIFPRSKS
jgi:hypothetical protein